MSPALAWPRRGCSHRSRRSSGAAYRDRDQVIQLVIGLSLAGVLHVHHLALERAGDRIGRTSRPGVARAADRLIDVVLRDSGIDRAGSFRRRKDKRHISRQDRIVGGLGETGDGVADRAIATCGTAEGVRGGRSTVGRRPMP